VASHPIHPAKSTPDFFKNLALEEVRRIYVDVGVLEPLREKNHF